MDTRSSKNAVTSAPAMPLEGPLMTRQFHSQDGDLAVAEPDYQRLDARRRDIVNHGISMQESSNTMSAIEYLKAHDIDARVIERVLLEPHRRRSTVHH